MQVTPRFPAARRATGMYESFYLRAVSPERPIGVWLRCTVHKAPGGAARGSVWCTLSDTRRPRPFMHKFTSGELVAPSGGWIAVGGQPDHAGGPPEHEGASMGPAHAIGRCGRASWSIGFASQERELRHLSPELLYRTPLPRTKLTSPAPCARFEGVVSLDGEPPLALDGWSGMVGHNWGSEHAARWIWLHALDLEQSPDAWLDVALARVALAGRLTPWLASGALSLNGRRQRLSGLRARVVQVDERTDGCELVLSGERGLRIDARARVPAGSAAGWRYADPRGGTHDVLNCSVAEVALTLSEPGGIRRELNTPHGGAYELGVRERDHGVAIAPFDDGW